VTLSDLDGPVIVITLYFTQNGVFRSQLHQIHCSL